MATPTERRLIQKKATTLSGARLVPLLEDLLEKPQDVETDEDFRYMNLLMRARAVQRQPGVFSPSMLGSCLRQAYFSKRGEKKVSAMSPQTHGYFLHGNFIHLKWQFACWKLHHQKLIQIVTVPGEGLLDFYGDGTRPAVECRVVDGDFGGTIDAIVIIDGLVYIVDFKGINLIDFQRTVKRGAKQEYRRQIVGYAMIAAEKLGLDVAGCLLVSECKAGPLSGGNALGLHETFVPIDEFSGDVSRRLRTLRWFDAKDERPPPECVSRNHMSFQECGYNRHCLSEVKEIQQRREAIAAATKRDWKVNRSTK